MANDPGSTLDDTGELQPSPPCTPCDGLFILGEARAYTLNKGEYTLFSIGEQLAATYEFCADDGEVSIWQWADEQWTPAGRLNNSFAVLALDAPGFVAATALTETALLTTSPVAPARLVVDRVFESFNDGETVAPVCVLPGSRLMLLAEAIGFTEDQPIPNEEFVQLRFFDADQLDGDGIELPASIVEPEHLEVEQLGDRRVISFQVPPNVGPAFGRLTVQWGELFFDGLDFEISTQDFFETRAQLTDLVSGAVSELFQTPPALIGGYRPLPAGAELTNGLNLEQIRTVEDENRWLFFAFDHQARFEQPEAIWILANAETQALELITGENAWPAVYQLAPDVPDDGLIARGSRVGLDFGSPDNQLNQLYGFGPLLQQRPVPDPRPRLKAGGKKSPLAGEPFLGGTKGKCPKICKIAILIQFDDNTKEKSRDGRPVPDFDQVMEHERRLAKNLGFDQIIELKPDDFLDFDDRGNPRWQSPTDKDSRNIKPLLDRIDKVIKGIRDCCTELAIFTNAHQNKSRYITYSNKDVARKPPGKGKKDVTGKINTGVLALLVAKQIQASTKAAKLKCQPPTELVFHTCFSGNFGDGRFFKASRLGLGVTASSGSNQTTKGRRNGGRAGADEFFFLEALQECFLADQGKTLKELFDCIIRKTRQRSGNTQTPKRRPPK